MYSTIKLRTRDFYEVIVDEGKVRFNHPLTEIEREYNLIVLCSRIREQTHKILYKNIEKGELEVISFFKMRQENDCFATHYIY